MNHAPDAPFRRVFIVGCPRSGTTVIQAMMASSQGVMSLGETNFATRLLGQFGRWLREDPKAERKWRQRLVLAKPQTHKVLQASLDAAFEDAGDTPRLHRHLSGRGYLREFGRVLDRTARRHGCHGWVEKTPDHLAYVDVLAEAFPDAHFLHVVRNAEDVLASAIDGQMRYSDHRVFAGSIPHWVARWNRAVGVHMRLAPDPRHTVLPYECLFTADQEARALVHAIVGVKDRADEDNQRHIADLGAEPWKRGSTDGRLKPPSRKFERIFGPDTQAWIRAHLVDYGTVLDAIAAAQPEYPWMARARDGVSTPPPAAS